VRVTWGVLLVALGLLAWLGQVVSLLAPIRAADLGLTEGEETVDAAFWADARGEAAWDALTLWTLPLAGVLLIADAASWPRWGLVGGAVFCYFGGRGVFARLAARRRGIAIGTDAAVRSAFVMLPVWFAAGVVTIGAALRAL
jgi:hypothetical protein